MTVPVQTPVTSSIANGVTTVFPFTFKIVSKNDLTVTVDGIVVTTGFNITGVGNDDGGDVTFDVAPANGLKVVRYSNPVLSRTIDYQQFGDWLAPIVNGDFDRIWLTLQSLYQALSRSIKLPVDVVAGQDITEDAADRANKVITFDEDGNVALKSGTELIPEVDQAVTNAQAAAAAAQAASTAADLSADAAAASALSASTTPVAAPTHAASSKATPVDNDEIPLIDSAASFGLKRLTWGNLKATLKSYFDTLYLAANTALGRRVYQVVTFTTGAVATGSTIIPYDDTIPQITEGDQYLSVSITPIDANSTLEIDVCINLASSGLVNLTAALFEVGTSNAKAAITTVNNPANNSAILSFKHLVVAGSLSARTYTVRAGSGSSTTQTLNGVSGGRLFGGVLSSRITVKEYLP